MVVDTSALVAILRKEPEAADFKRRLIEDPVVFVSTATYVETAMVLEGRFGQAAGEELERLLFDVGAEFVPLVKDHAEIARQAFVQYGKGRHPAGLNFGDCMSYALAKATGEPLLYKGDDFSRTDVPRF